MQPHDGNSPIRITLDISVPVNGGQVSSQIVQPAPAPLVAPRAYSLASIDHPDPNGTTLVKKICDRWYLCAHGTVDGARHVFARVYEGTDTPDATPPAGLDTAWVSTIGSTAWRIDLLPLPAGTDLGTSKKIAVWHENGTGGYAPAVVHTFSATASAYTYCMTYGSVAEAMKAKKPIAKDWNALPDRWQFQVAGYSNLSACNCSSLNGTWILTRTPQVGNDLIWQHQLGASFTDPKRPSWWRLFFNPRDGFWYLDCAVDPKQPAGVSVTYRRHETAWNPHGANEMLLQTNHGYCHAAEFVTLYPA